MKAPLMACLLALGILSTDAVLAQEDATDVVAAAVRDRGYACDSPEAATPDPERSSPDERAWIIRCGSESYSVRFMGDEGAEVEPLDE